MANQVTKTPVEEANNVLDLLASIDAVLESGKTRNERAICFKVQNFKNNLAAIRTSLQDEGQDQHRVMEKLLQVKITTEALWDKVTKAAAHGKAQAKRLKKLKSKSATSTAPKAPSFLKVSNDLRFKKRKAVFEFSDDGDDEDGDDDSPSRQHVLRKIERRKMLENEENEEQIAKPVFRAAGAPVAGQSTEKTKSTPVDNSLVIFLHHQEDPTVKLRAKGQPERVTIKYANLKKYSRTLTSLFSEKWRDQLDDPNDKVVHLPKKTAAPKKYIHDRVIYPDELQHSEFAKDRDSYEYIKDMTYTDFWGGMKTFAHWADTQLIRATDNPNNIDCSMDVAKFLGVDDDGYIQDLLAADMAKR